MSHTRPIFWAGLVGLPLVIITVWAYYYWYQMLVARGYGYMYNDIKFQVPFRLARYCLAAAVCVGLVTLELTRRHIPKYWRYGYVLILGFGMALFAVSWIVRHFAVTPFWHHPVGCRQGRDRASGCNCTS
jgi:hypothetical protein